MSDQSTDPILELERFGTGGVPVTPLDPALVRRLGDRRRNRRRAAVLAASVAVIATAVVPTVLLNQGGTTKGTHLLGTPTPAPTPTVIGYPSPGIELTSPSQVDKLTGTSPAFKAFIADQVTQAIADGAGCPGAAHGVTVQKYSTAGFAIGAVNSCGGYAALWANFTYGPGVPTWIEGQATQDAWDCAALGYLGVPTSFSGPCANESGSFGPDEVSGIRLGMTAAQVAAAGGRVTSGSPGPCAIIMLPHEFPVRDQGEVLLSPTLRVAAIFARPTMKTPKGVGLGSTRAAVQAAYPNGTAGIGTWRVQLGGGREYEFGIDGMGKQAIVTTMTLQLHNHGCFG